MLAKLELQGEKKKKTKQLGKNFKAIKYNKIKIRKYHHLFSLLRKKSPINFPF
jgi:hypothetical protein